MNGQPTSVWGPVDAEHFERRGYVAGWWWGFSSGLICGAGSMVLLGWLVYAVWQALQCPQC